MEESNQFYLWMVENEISEVSAKKYCGAFYVIIKEFIKYVDSINNIEDMKKFVDKCYDDEVFKEKNNKGKRMYSNALKNYIKYLESEKLKKDNLNEIEHKQYVKVISNSEELRYIKDYIKSKGYNYSSELIDNFYLSLKTKPFIILSGISGTGKSKIVKLFAEAIGATTDNGRFNLIPVRPDWSDDSELLGYRDIEGNFKAGILTSILKKANENLNEPYFICLDEMNLARVEYYFSSILSLIETREFIDGEIKSNRIFSKESFGTDNVSYDDYKDVYISENIFIIGTVNMDETTFPFSKKVLDRANTIEFNEVNLDFDFLFRDGAIESRVYDNSFLKSNYLKISDSIEHKEIAVKVIEALKVYNSILLKGNHHFAYRTRDEIVFYVINAVNYNLMDLHKAMDYAIVQKILPKVGGSSEVVIEVLVELFNELNKTSYKGNDVAFGNVEFANLEEDVKEYTLSSEKIIYMIKRYLKDGFTGFWQ